MSTGYHLIFALHHKVVSVIMLNHIPEQEVTVSPGVTADNFFTE
jgi:hypothetical protein